MKINCAQIAVQVQPNSRKNEVVSFEDGVLKVKIAALPVKGKANKELIDFLSSILKISKGSIVIEKGLTSKRKGIAVEGLTQDEVTSRLSSL